MRRASGRCAPCTRASNRRWDAENPESGRASSRKWRAANLEEAREKDRAYYAVNPARRAENSRKWQAANPERCAENGRKWRTANPEVVCAKAASRRAAQLQRTPAWADLGAIAIIYAEAARTQRETGMSMNVDHIIPLQGKTVSGLHVAANLRPLPARENGRKHNRFEPASLEVSLN